MVEAVGAGEEIPPTPSYSMSTNAIARDHCLAPERVGGSGLRRPLPAPVRVAAAARLRGRGAARARRPGRHLRRRRGCRRPTVRWPPAGRSSASSSPTTSPPTARRSATAPTRADPQLPHPAGQPRGRLRRRPGRLAVPVPEGRPGQAPARRGRPRRPAQPRGDRAGRRPAQRRPPLHEPDAGGVHRLHNRARRPAARRRRRRGRGLRRGPARGHLALPARDPARVPAAADRRRADGRAARGGATLYRAGRRSVHPVRVRRRRLPVRPLPDPRRATRSTRASVRCPCSPI